MTTAVSLAQSVAPGVSLGFKNRIINGGMVIDQRNAGASVTPGSTLTYTLDRWRAYLSQGAKFSVQQNAGSVTPPVGFTNYLGITSLSAYSVGASEIFTINQFIEGYNVADLGWGTANAKPITLSFWVRSSLTGTFGGSFNSNGQARSYAFSYTISAANTWEYKTVTIAGDTTGTWETTNGRGLEVWFSVGSGSSVSTTTGSWVTGSYYSATGSTNVLATNGATFYITGVQLEVGTTATSFEFRDYGRELQMCQRYFEKAFFYNIWSGYATNGSANFNNVFFKVNKRTNPTITWTLIAAANFGGSLITNGADVDGAEVYMVANASGNGYYQYTWTSSAEL